MLALWIAQTEALSVWQSLFLLALSLSLVPTLVDEARAEILKEVENVPE